LPIDFRPYLSSLPQKPPTPVLGETFWENLLINIFDVVNTA